MVADFLQPFFVSRETKIFISHNTIQFSVVLYLYLQNKI